MGRHAGKGGMVGFLVIFLLCLVYGQNEDSKKYLEGISLVA